MWTAYTITQDKQGKSWWNKIGVAFQNNDGSFNIRLFGLPTNGEIQIREDQERDARPAPQQRQQSRRPPANAAPVNEDGDDDIPF